MDLNLGSPAKCANHYAMPYPQIDYQFLLRKVTCCIKSRLLLFMKTEKLITPIDRSFLNKKLSLKWVSFETWKSTWMLGWFDNVNVKPICQSCLFVVFWTSNLMKKCLFYHLMQDFMIFYLQEIRNKETWLAKMS